MAAAERTVWPDVMRGYCILCVVAIHATGHAMARSTPQAWSWCLLALLNRSLQFAVPAFLFVSAYANGCSLRRPRAALGDWYRRRLLGAGVPYLLASAAGLAIGFHRHSVAWADVPRILATGRALTHLYFMVLLFQMYLVLPILVRTIRPGVRLRVPLALAGGIQAIVYAVHWLRPDLGFLQTSITWYALPIVLGTWASGAPRSVERLSSAWAALSVVAYLIYAPLAVAALVMPVDTRQFQTAEWMYTTSVVLALACAGAKLGSGRASAALAWLGRRSLGIYLLHPFVLLALDRLPGPPSVVAMSGWYFAAGLGLSVVAVAVGSAAQNRVQRASKRRGRRQVAAEGRERAPLDYVVEPATSD